MPLPLTDAEIAAHPFVTSWSVPEGRPVKAGAREEFMKWIRLPKKERETVNQLATRIGVHHRTVYAWMKDPLIYTDHRLELVEQIMDHMPEVIANMARLAKDTSNKSAAVQAARTLAQFKEQFAPSIEAEIDVKKLSDDELRELMVSSLDELDERTHTT